MHVVETGRHGELRRAAADARHARPHGGEQRVRRRGVARVVVGNLLDGDPARRDLFRRGLEPGAEFALGIAHALDRQHAAVDGEAGGGGHGVDLAPLAGGEDAAEVDGRVHAAPVGRTEGAPREQLLVAVEREHERGHLLEGVDAGLGRGAVGGAAVDADIEPHDAVVAAAHAVALAALAHHGVVGAQFAVAGDPARAQRAVGLLVGGERHLDVEVGLHARGAQGLQGEDDAGDGALHVGGAAAVDPAVLHDGVERAAVPPLAGDRHDVVVRVEMDGLFRAGVPEADDVIARVIEQLRLGLLLERARNRQAAHRQAEAAQRVREQGRDLPVVLARGVDRAQPDQLLQEGDEVGLVAVEVAGGGHAGIMGPRSRWRK